MKKLISAEGEIVVELDVRAKRSGDYLIIEATPDEYDDGTDDDADTIDSAVAYVSEDAPDVSGNEDPCEDGVKEDGDTYDKTPGDIKDIGFGVELPEETDDMYYCFGVTDDVGATGHSVVYTNVYHHATDSTPPRIAFRLQQQCPNCYCQRHGVGH